MSGTTWIGSKVYDMETSDDARSQLDNLIVEAEPSVQGLLSRCLIDDYRVLTASSGQAATDMLEVEEIDLVLCDQVLPDMTGV